MIATVLMHCVVFGTINRPDTPSVNYIIKELHDG